MSPPEVDAFLTVDVFSHLAADFLDEDVHELCEWVVFEVHHNHFVVTIFVAF